MFPLLVTGAALAIPEERVRSPGVMAGSGRPRGMSRGVSPAPNEGVVAAFKQQATLLWATAKQRTILLPAIFVFLWQVRRPGLCWRMLQDILQVAPEPRCCSMAQHSICATSAAPGAPGKLAGQSNRSPPLFLRPQATPTADTAMLFFETNKLGFTPEVLGRIRCANRLV